MALSIFEDKSHIPTDEDVADALGQSVEYWNRIVEQISTIYAPIVKEWNFAGKKYGYAARLKRKKRAIIYLIPQDKTFMIGFVLGQKAVDELNESDVSQEIVDLVNGARKYAEGRGARVEITSDKDVEDVIKIAAIKMAN